jgi:hypothetical protein
MVHLVMLIVFHMNVIKVQFNVLFLKNQYIMYIIPHLYVVKHFWNFDILNFQMYILWNFKVLNFHIFEIVIFF